MIIQAIQIENGVLEASLIKSDNIQAIHIENGVVEAQEIT